MLSTRDIQRKIRTIRNIQQICRAMKTVSSIKLKKAEERIRASRPYAGALREMVSHLVGAEYPHPLLEVREVQTTGIVAISADKGLAGSYNANLVREALRLVRKQDSAVKVVPIGRKVNDTFRRAGFDIELAIPNLGQSAEFRSIAALADQIGERYAQGVWDRVELIYTEFGGKVTVQQLLPILPPEGEEAHGDIIYEPSPAAIIEQILPRYLRTVLFTAVLSAIAAEHAARVAAMSLATENADDLISQFTMDYNKSRQAAITNELSDIVNSAEALR
ncbi:MAG TPA: ATP synthase F1 subunit gamma [Armatimonadota bacterium]|jgi:F-type H+-transporting ATPase subunit gamma